MSTEQSLERLHGMHGPRACVIEAHVRRRPPAALRSITRTTSVRFQNISEQGFFHVLPLLILRVVVVVVAVVACWGVSGIGDSSSCVFHDEDEVGAKAALRGAYESLTFRGGWVSGDNYLDVFVYQHQIWRENTTNEERGAGIHSFCRLQLQQSSGLGNITSE